MEGQGSSSYHLIILVVLTCLVTCENQNIVELKKTVAALQDIKNYLRVCLELCTFGEMRSIYLICLILSGYPDTGGEDAGSPQLQDRVPPGRGDIVQ